MTAALRFFVLIEVLGLAATPLAAVVFARLPGRGVAFAKPLGLLLATWLVWVGGSLRLVPQGLATWIARRGRAGGGRRARVVALAAGAAAAGAAVVGGARARRVRGDGAARRLLARRLADREADGHGVHQRRRRRAPLPARGPVDGGGGPQLLLPRPPDGGRARAAVGGGAGRRLQPRGRDVLRAVGGGGVRARLRARRPAGDRAVGRRAVHRGRDDRLRARAVSRTAGRCAPTTGSARRG